MNNLAAQMLERYPADGDRKDATVRMSGTRDTVDKFLLALSTAAYLGDVGSSRELQIGIDGDGHERLEVELEGGDMPEPADTDSETIAIDA